MNTLQSLLESANPWQSLQNDAVRLSNKWVKTGLLDDLKTEVEKNNMSMILENQAKQLVVEASQTGNGVSGASFTAGSGEQWAGVALPLVRKLFGQIAAKEFVSVQPMNMPSGLVFFLDFQYGTSKNPFTAGGGSGFYGTSSLYGNTNPGAGVDPNGGLYGAGRFTYTTNNTSSLVAAANVTVTSASWTDFNLDPFFSASIVASTQNWKVVNVPLPAGTDWNAVRGFILTSGSFIQVSDNLQAFTKVTGAVSFNSAGTASFVISGSVVGQVASIQPTVTFQLQPTDNSRGDFEWNNTVLNTNNSSSTFAIPEINIKMKSEPIVAKTKKLKAVWTPEFSTDLNKYQSLDAEAEVTSIMSEYISLEIDMEIIDMLINNASAGVEYWSAINNDGISVSGTTVTRTALGYYNTQGGWFQTLGTKISKLSNQVHQKTMRGGINFIVCSPAVSTVLESIPGFAADTQDTETMKYAFGVQKAGSINGRYKVYKNPYMTENTVLLGYKGSQFLETGAVFAPYVPLIMTPLVYDPQTYVPGKGLLTRYAKKMVRPEFYAKLFVTGINTI